MGEMPALISGFSVLVKAAFLFFGEATWFLSIFSEAKFFFKVFGVRLSEFIFSTFSILRILFWNSDFSEELLLGLPLAWLLPLNSDFCVLTCPTDSAERIIIWFFLKIPIISVVYRIFAVGFSFRDFVFVVFNGFFGCFFRLFYRIIRTFLKRFHQVAEHGHYVVGSS